MSIFDSAIFDSAIFDTDGASAATPTGGKSDNQQPIAVKPTGLPAAKRGTLKARNAEVQRRLDESVEIQAEIAAEASAEPLASPAPQPVSTISMLEVEQEIGRLLHKQLRNEEDELMLLLLMAAATT